MIEKKYIFGNFTRDSLAFPSPSKQQKKKKEKKETLILFHVVSAKSVFISFPREESSRSIVV